MGTQGNSLFLQIFRGAVQVDSMFSKLLAYF